MARGKGDIKGWITKNGVHIPIYGEYTVRGGVEPKAKGSKFRGSKKKFDHSKRPDTWIDKKDKVTRKQFEENVESYPVGTYVKMNAGGNMNGFGSNMNYVKTGDDEWTAYSDIGGYSDTKRTTADLVKNLDKKKIKNIAVKDDLVDKGTSKDNKYKDRDWNKDVDDAKRYGYSEQTEEGKKPVTKAEEEKQARQSFRDKKAQEQGFADDASMRSYNEETGVNRESWKEGKKPTSFQEQVNDRFKTKKEWDEIAKNAGYKDSNDPEFQKNADDIVAKNKQAKTTPDMRDETKSLGDGGKVTSRIKAQEQSYVDNAFKPQVSEKERKMQELRDAERAYVNEAFEGNTKQASSTPDFSKMSYSEAGKYVSEHKKDFGLKPGDDAYQAAYEMKQGTWKGQMSGQESSMKDSYSQETFGKNYSELNNDERQHVDEWAPKEKSTNTSKNTVSTTESYPWTKSFGSSEPSASEYGKAMDSINERYDRETKTVPGKEMGKVFEGLKPGDQIKVHNRWSTSPDTYTVNEDGTIDYSTPSSAFLGKEGMSLAEAQKHATNSVDNRITVMRRKSEGSSNPKSKQDSLSAGMNERSRIRGELHAKDKAMKAAMPTTVSGLRSAYADATGSMKSKIAAELRRKGYSLVGGKWVKGNKS